MKRGDVVLIVLPQGGGVSKLRPALVLGRLPGRHDDWLLCGISSQVRLFAADWDELLRPTDTDFARSGLRVESVVRLNFLHAMRATEMVGRIGSLPSARVELLCQRLAKFLTQ